MKDAFQKLFYYLDRYFVSDIESMINSNNENSSSDGRMNFPIILMILIVMELLGRVLADKELTNKKAFLNFWDNFFIKKKANYKGLGDIFHDSIRNGLAHSFFPKSGIYVTKMGKGNITKKRDGRLNVDAITFYEDFRNVYDSLKSELADDKKIEEKYGIGYRYFLQDIKNGKSAIEEFIKNNNLELTSIFGSPATEIF